MVYIVIDVVYMPKYGDYEFIITTRYEFLGWLEGYVLTKADSKHVEDFLRSEEHTSELQSPCNLVCRLLLEKKKKHQYLLIKKQVVPSLRCLSHNIRGLRPYHTSSSLVFTSNRPTELDKPTHILHPYNVRIL